MLLIPSYCRASLFGLEQATSWSNPYKQMCTSTVIVPLPREGCEILWWVCLSVCLSVRSHNWKTPRLNITNFCTLSVAVAQSLSDGVAMRYVLPILWIMSCFLLVPAHPGCPGQIPQSRKTVVCFIPWSKWAKSSTTTLCLEKKFARPGVGTGWTSRQLHCLVEFIRMQHRSKVSYLRLTCFDCTAAFKYSFHKNLFDKLST